MTSLHLNPEAARTGSQSLKNAEAALAAHLQELAGTNSRLDSAWQGGGKDAFSADMDSLLKGLRGRQEEISLLIARLEREITEWEETDRMGASRWREGRWISSWLADRAALPVAAGVAGLTWQNIATILPLSTAISIGSFLAGIPAWLKALLDQLFPTPPIISPIVDEPPVIVKPEEPVPPVEVKPPPPVVEPAPTGPDTPTPDPATTGELDISYPVTPQSQGSLYGNAACAPTSVSMVLDYYHTLNPDNQTVTTEALIGMLDAGDGTPGRGMSLSNLDDELKSLGYDQITTKVGASLDDLETQLKAGPVIITAGVKIVGPGSMTPDVPRAVTGPGSVGHAMVVTGMSDDIVVVNDPWSGTEMQIPIDTFTQMWTNGSSGLYAIQP